MGGTPPDSALRLPLSRSPPVERCEDGSRLVSQATLPRLSNGHRYCWAEHPRTHVRCTDPAGHSGTHWHAYSKTSW